MSLSDTDNRVPYAGDGSSTAFAWAKLLHQKADLKAVLVDDDTGAETPWVLDTDFTFAGTLTDGVYANGGTLTASVAPAVGETLILYRDPEETQETEWQDNDPDPAKTKENAFDKLTMLVIRLIERMGFSIELPVGWSGDWDSKLPYDFEAGDVIVVNETRDGWDTLSPDDLANQVVKGEMVIADSQAVAAAITDMTLDAALYSSGFFTCEFVRGTTIMGIVQLALLRLNGVWVISEGNSVGEGLHGLTFSVTETGGVAQVKYVSDASGAGTLKWKRMALDA
jgi:hypothetical protein